MITEESSQQQLTPLPEEHGEAPVPTHDAGEPERSLVTNVRWPRFLDVIKAIGIWVVSILLLLFMPLVAILPYVIYKLYTVGPSVLTPEALTQDKWLIFYSVVGILPTHLITLAFTWFMVTEGGRRPFWKAIGWEWPGRPSRVTIFSILVALGLYGIALGVTTIWGGSKTDLDLLIESSMYTRVATALVAVVTAPLVEEVIYRGVLYPAVEKVTGPAFAVAVVSLLFAGVHVWQYRTNIGVILVITALSFTLTIARAVTGKLLPSFIIHLVFNGIQSVLIVLSGFMDKDLIK
ncbi:MAG TPA: type II CAAX endopeptidase family protein [Pyrinomonadaceae bacterium]|nr:type II CAAX endopeptidase family protein [Pyrinomonadaceae bacterium]